MLASAMGLVVAVPVVGFVSWAAGTPTDDALGTSLRWLAFGAAYGLVTGSTLLWLLKERVSLATP